jgi:predicted phage terminase large subunit-like protein
MAADLDQKFRRTPAIDLINEAIVRCVNTVDGRLIVVLPPQTGKSTLVTKWLPTWLLHRDPDLRNVVASYAASVARRMGRLVRNEIEWHSTELNLKLSDAVGAQNEFEIAGHAGGVYSIGLEGSLTSRPADVMIIDDPLKDRIQADSIVYRDRVWEWWTDTGSTRLAPGAPVILVLTRWHHDDLAGRLLAAEDGHLWEQVRVPAQADHKPENGETDPLGREPGEFMLDARGRTDKQWDAIKVRSGPRTWAALYQGRPTPGVGGIFPPSEEWARYTQPLWIERPDGSRWVPVSTSDAEHTQIVQSWDMAFKDLASSDYVVGQVWLRRGVEMFLLDQVRARLNFTATLQAVKDLSARWPQAVAKFVEDKANGTAVINALSLSTPGLIPVEPEGGKPARAAAVSPLVWAKNIVIPDSSIAPWVVDLTDEIAEFPNGANDDTVDCLSQAVNRVLLQPIMAGQTFTSDDLLDSEDDDAGAYDYLPTY